jgi:hypothetical protein
MSLEKGNDMAELNDEEREKKLKGLRYIGESLLCELGSCACKGGKHPMILLNSPFFAEGETYWESGSE